MGNKKRGRNRERKKGSKIGKVTGGKRERGGANEATGDGAEWLGMSGFGAWQGRGGGVEGGDGVEIPVE